MLKSVGSKLNNSIRFARYSTKSLTKTQKPNVIKPFENPDFFDIKKLVDLRELFQ
jgi:hypothetical protein